MCIETTQFRVYRNDTYLTLTGVHVVRIVDVVYIADMGIELRRVSGIDLESKDL